MSDVRFKLELSANVAEASPDWSIDAESLINGELTQAQKRLWEPEESLLERTPEAFVENLLKPALRFARSIKIIDPYLDPENKVWSLPYLKALEAAQEGRNSRKAFTSS